MERKIGLIAVAAILGAISCADLPKTSDPRFVGEPYYVDDYENLDEATRKETEYKADSIIRKYNNKFADGCTQYSENQNPNSKHAKHRHLNCVTFK